MGDNASDKDSTGKKGVETESTATENGDESLKKKQSSGKGDPILQEI